MGTWPAEFTGSGSLESETLGAYAERLKSAMTKAVREAKVNSTWDSPNSAYENALLDLVANRSTWNVRARFWTPFFRSSNGSRG